MMNSGTTHLIAKRELMTPVVRRYLSYAIGKRPFLTPSRTYLLRPLGSHRITASRWLCRLPAATAQGSSTILTRSPRPRHPGPHRHHILLHRPAAQIPPTPLSPVLLLSRQMQLLRGRHAVHSAVHGRRQGRAVGSRVSGDERAGVLAQGLVCVSCVCRDGEDV
jgi:hypothetical protein